MAKTNVGKPIMSMRLEKKTPRLRITWTRRYYDSQVNEIICRYIHGKLSKKWDKWHVHWLNRRDILALRHKYTGWGWTIIK